MNQELLIEINPVNEALFEIERVRWNELENNQRVKSAHLQMAESKSPAVQELHNRAMSVARNYSKLETELLDIFEELDHTRAYLHFGVTSLIGYAIEVLKLSEGAASNLVTVSRKSTQFPALKQAIAAGEVTVSKARKIAPVLTKENQAKWIDLAKNSTSRVIEKEVARVNPQAAVPERLKYKTAERLELSFGISEELAEKFKRVKDLLAQKQSKSISSEEALEALVTEFIERHDPIKKAERAKERSSLQSNVQRVPGRVESSKFSRTPVPSAVKHAVTLRDLRQCTYIGSNGKRCGSTKWLDVHHVVPISRGGSNDLANLATLCSSHHRMTHLHN